MLRVIDKLTYSFSFVKFDINLCVGLICSIRQVFKFIIISRVNIFPARIFVWRVSGCTELSRVSLKKKHELLHPTINDIEYICLSK